MGAGMVEVAPDDDALPAELGVGALDEADDIVADSLGEVPLPDGQAYLGREREGDRPLIGCQGLL
jgi:hypothetical protein